MSKRCTITKVHCEECGSTDDEDLGTFEDRDDGYTTCCNELTATAQSGCRNFHAED